MTAKTSIMYISLHFSFSTIKEIQHDPDVPVCIVIIISVSWYYHQLPDFYYHPLHWSVILCSITIWLIIRPCIDWNRITMISDIMRSCVKWNRITMISDIVRSCVEWNRITVISDIMRSCVEWKRITIISDTMRSCVKWNRFKIITRSDSSCKYPSLSCDWFKMKVDWC